MNKWMLFGVLLAMGGCTSSHCGYDPGRDPGQDRRQDEHCRADHLLYRNDMLQAKLLISQGDPQEYELAHALLQRAAQNDDSGEAEFYQAVLLIREQGAQPDILRLLRRAADYHHPLAIALLARQVADQDPQQAEHWRNEYAGLDVARSGYPSFEQAQAVLDQLVIPVTQTAAAPDHDL